MMGHKQKLKQADEYDFVYARGFYCYLVNNVKRKRQIKKRLSKRNRVENKRIVREYII